MGSSLYHVRQQCLRQNINNNSYKLLKLNTQKQQFTNFSNVISTGINFSSEALASLGSELYGVALDVMCHGNQVAMEDAEDMTNTYADMFQKLGEEQYNNSGYAAQAAIYKNEDGSLNTEAAWQKFYEEALKSYIEEEITPLIQKKETEIADEQARIEAILRQEEAELETVRAAEENAIKNENIRLVA